MELPSESRVTQRTALVLAATAAAFGLLALYGWMFNLPVLYGKLSLDAPLTRPLSAIALMLGGMALYAHFATLALSARAARIWRGIAKGCSSVVLLIALDSLAFHVLGLSTGLGRFFAGKFNPESAVDQLQGNLPLPGAVLLAITGIAILLGCFLPPVRWLVRLHRVLCLLAIGGGFWALMDPLLQLHLQIGLGLNTAVGCVMLGGAALLLRPPGWLLETLFSGGPAGRLSRLLPAVVFVPFLLGQLPGYFVQRGLISAPLANQIVVLLFAMGVTACFWIALRMTLVLGHRNSALERLAEQESLYELIVESSRDGICLTDEKGHFVFANKRMGEILHQDIQELVGQDASQHLRGDAAAGFIERLEQRRNGQHQEQEFLLHRQDGTTVWVLAATRPVYARDGSFDGSLSIVTDVNDRKERAEEQARWQAQLLQSQKMEAVGTLAGGIAHDFNNILTAILGYADLAKSSLQGPEMALECLDEIETGARRAASLVQQILTFSRRAESHKRPMRIAQEVSEVTRLIRAALPTTIKIEVDNKAPGAILSMDPTQFHQVLMNLCANAGYALHETGGTLRISLRVQHISPGEAARKLGLSSGPYVLLSVEDNGPGIPPEIRERIFEPFFTTKEVGKGTGLGLSTVHGIVLEAGGGISLYSELGAGTTFNIYLPLSTVENEVEHMPTNKPASGSARILFVDDEAPLVKMGMMMLGQAGYDVTPAASGQEAIVAFQQDPFGFDILITDQTMPGMTGLQLTAALQEQRSELPVIICSGFSQTTIELEPHGFTQHLRFVPKPYTLQSLHEAIEELLGQREPTPGQPGRNGALAPGSNGMLAPGSNGALLNGQGAEKREPVGVTQPAPEEEEGVD
jgi:PAS domain S-box-containing protein